MGEKADDNDEKFSVNSLFNHPPMHVNHKIATDLQSTAPPYYVRCHS